MIRYIKEKLFGTWEVKKEMSGELYLTPSLAIRNSSLEFEHLSTTHEGVFVVEENTKTNEKRAYFEFPDGDKRKLSVRWVESKMKNAV